MGMYLPPGKSFCNHFRTARNDPEIQDGGRKFKCFLKNLEQIYNSDCMQDGIESMTSLP